MGYYNFMYIFKNILYNIKSCLKYFVIGLCLIFVILFILTIAKVSATTITYQGVDGSAFSQADFTDINNSFNNLRGSYDSYVCVLVPGHNAYMYLFNYSDSNRVSARLTTDGYIDNRIVSADNYSYSVYELLGGGRGNLIVNNANSNLGNAYYSDFTFNNNLPYICSNIPIYNYSNSNIFWAPANFSVDIPPSIENFKNQNVINSMIAR